MADGLQSLEYFCQAQGVSVNDVLETNGSDLEEWIHARSDDPLQQQRLWRDVTFALLQQRNRTPLQRRNTLAQLSQGTNLSEDELLGLPEDEFKAKCDVRNNGLVALGNLLAERRSRLAQITEHADTTAQQDEGGTVATQTAPTQAPIVIDSDTAGANPAPQVVVARPEAQRRSVAAPVPPAHPKPAPQAAVTVPPARAKPAPQAVVTPPRAQKRCAAAPVPPAQASKQQRIAITGARLARPSLKDTIYSKLHELQSFGIRSIPTELLAAIVDYSTATKTFRDALNQLRDQQLLTYKMTATVQLTASTTTTATADKQGQRQMLRNALQSLPKKLYGSACWDLFCALSDGKTHEEADLLIAVGVGSPQTKKYTGSRSTLRKLGLMESRSLQLSALGRQFSSTPKSQDGNMHVSAAGDGDDDAGGSSDADGECGDDDEIEFWTEPTSSDVDVVDLFEDDAKPAAQVNVRPAAADSVPPVMDPMHPSAEDSMTPSTEDSVPLSAEDPTPQDERTTGVNNEMGSTVVEEVVSSSTVVKMEHHPHTLEYVAKQHACRIMNTILRLHKSKLKVRREFVQVFAKYKDEEEFTKQLDLCKKNGWVDYNDYIIWLAPQGQEETSYWKEVEGGRVTNQEAQKFLLSTIVSNEGKAVFRALQDGLFHTRDEIAKAAGYQAATDPVFTEMMGTIEGLLDCPSETVVQLREIAFPMGREYSE